MLLHNPARRRGAPLVECAFIIPLTFLLVAGLVVCAMGVFRYQQMAHLAREAARYAAVHAMPPSSDLKRAYFISRLRQATVRRGWR